MSKKKGNELALTSNTSIPDMMSVLEEKIKSLAHITDSAYVTSGQLEGVGDIKSETKIENLIRAKASIMVREEYYDKAATSLGRGASYPEFKLGGYTSKEWDKDIILRIAIIENKENLDKLNYFKTQAAKFMSEQDQKQMLFKEMETFFGGAGAALAAGK